MSAVGATDISGSVSPGVTGGGSAAYHRRRVADFMNDAKQAFCSGPGAHHRYPVIPYLLVRKGAGESMVFRTEELVLRLYTVVQSLMLSRKIMGRTVLLLLAMVTVSVFLKFDFLISGNVVVANNENLMRKTTENEQSLVLRNFKIGWFKARKIVSETESSLQPQMKEMPVSSAIKH